MQKITLALDWTPNTNHIGFFVAREKGFFREEGLEVELLDPAADNYQVTPAKKVELGRADFALCPLESVISYRTKDESFPLKAVAAILQEDLSAIACKAGTGIHSPRDLDGKVYASYHARYEDGIVRQMIRNDGGRGDLRITYPDKLGIWETLLKDKADATWIFLNWEGVQAETEGVGLTYFKMKDYGIPYSYSPVIGADQTRVTSHREPYRAFLAGSKRGFLYAKEHPEEAASILAAYVPEGDRSIDLLRSLQFSSPHFGEEADWGRMEKERVASFLNWIYENDLERMRLEVTDLITNTLLEG